MDAKLTRTVIRVGNSLGITIPQEECQGKKAGDRVIVTLDWVTEGVSP